ncbi:excisionase family DNA binding protein [Nitrobacteraceae bacterium AZCC 2161]
MEKRQADQVGAPDDCLVYEVPEAGALLGLNRNGSYRAAKNGDLPTIRIGRLLKVPKAALHQMLASSAKAS